MLFADWPLSRLYLSAWLWKMCWMQLPRNAFIFVIPKSSNENNIISTRRENVTWVWQVRELSRALVACLVMLNKELGGFCIEMSLLITSMLLFWRNSSESTDVWSQSYFYKQFKLEQFFFFFSETRDILNLAICSSNFINLLTFFLPLSFFSSADMRNTAVCATFQRWSQFFSPFNELWDFRLKTNCIIRKVEISLRFNRRLQRS